MDTTFSRRFFLKGNLAAAVMAQMRLRVFAEEVRHGIPYRDLGTTKTTQTFDGTVQHPEWLL